MAATALSLVLLSGCTEGSDFQLRDLVPDFAKPKETEAAGSGGAAAAPATASSETVTRDVEAPEIFSAQEAGLWDGRPSLGGVWVAHPDVTDPERVLIRNETNQKFVVGALFRKERDIPGPKLQVSSDAAEALGMLAGAPVALNVVALREETVEVAPVVTEEPVEIVEIPEAEVVESTTLDPIAAATAALDAPAASDTTEIAAATIEPVAAAPAPEPRPVSRLDKPYLQIGIFSVEDNARRVADQMRRAGMIPEVKQGSNSGKSFWRVVVGPAQSSSERRTLLNRIKAEGFKDAYAVSS